MNLIAGGALALLGNPGQLSILREGPAAIPNAVEEFLRYDSPVQTSRRITLEPVTVDGPLPQPRPGRRRDVERAD